MEVEAEPSAENPSDVERAKLVAVRERRLKLVARNAPLVSVEEDVGAARHPQVERRSRERERPHRARDRRVATQRQRYLDVIQLEQRVAVRCRSERLHPFHRVQQLELRRETRLEWRHQHHAADESVAARSRAKPIAGERGLVESRRETESRSGKRLVRELRTDRLAGDCKRHHP